MGRGNGMMVALEGVDAVGKKTQSSLLIYWLRSRNFRANDIAFPDYSTAIGREIRDYLHGRRPYSAEVGHMLYAANRWENKQVIESMLAESDVLVVNRYTPSNYAYGTANGLKLEWLTNLEEGLPKADLVLVLDAPPATLSNRRGSSRDTYERNINLQERVRQAYLDLADRFGWVVVNAARDIRATNEELISVLSAEIHKKGGRK